MDRILVCSDIHGEFYRFQHLLEKAAYHPSSDQLILLGDYIDRGSYTKEVVEYVMELVENGAVALKGNHEQMFLKSFHNKNMREAWIVNGGLKTVNSYPYDEVLMKEHADWMEKNLQLHHETEQYIFVHAGLKPYVPLKLQHEDDLLWIRRKELIGLGKTVIHGHTPVKQVEQLFDRIYIDTGATYGGRLSLLELPSMKVYEA